MVRARCKGICKERGYSKQWSEAYINGDTFCSVCNRIIPKTDLVNNRCPCCGFLPRTKPHYS